MATPRSPSKDAFDLSESASVILDVVPLVMDALRSAMRRHVGDQLSVPQFRCLNFIARGPGISVGAVAAFLGVTMPTASAMVDRLVQSGAVAAQVSTTDRRRSQLRITRSGVAQLRRIRRGARDEIVRALTDRSADELRMLHAGLDVLRRTFASS